MSGKNENKKFNGEGVVEFEEFCDTLLTEADKRSCGKHFRWNDADVRPDGYVPEEEFPHTRQCEPGKEEEVAEAKMMEKLERLKLKWKVQRRRVRMAYPQGEATKEIARLNSKYEDDKEALESGLDKTVNELKSACDLYDKKLKLFEDSRAQAVALLNQWLGPSSRNLIYVVLKDRGPKNAWKRLMDGYADESQTDLYLNSVTTRMGALIFSNKLGKVVDHNAYLDKLNAPLVRRGHPISDGQLLNYLIEAVKRNKEAMTLYGKAIDSIFIDNKPRANAISLLIRMEHAKEANAEVNGERTNSAGAQFAKVRGAFAGTASARPDKKAGTKRKRDGGSGGGSAAGGEEQKKKKPATATRPKPECSRCGSTEHLRRDCHEEVYCQPCDAKTHSEKVCWKAHPEKVPAHFKKKVNSAEAELKGGDRETLDCEGVHCTPQTMAAAPGPRSVTSTRVEVLDDSTDEEVMSLTATIQEELLRKLHMTSCSDCEKRFCGLGAPGDEEGKVESVALGHSGENYPGPVTVIVDSGATRHMVPWRWMFTRVRHGVQGKVTLGNKSYSLSIDGVGKTSMACLNEVLWVPDLSMGLLSVPQLDKEGFTTTIGSGKCTVTHQETGEVVLTATLRRNLYVVDKEFMEHFNGADVEDDVEVEQAMPAEEERAELRGSAQPRLSQTTAGQKAIDVLHRRLGHVSEAKLKSGLRNKIWTGAQYSYEDVKDQRLSFCPACQEGRMKAFPRQPVSEKVVEPGAKFGVDYKGKFSVTSIDGYNGFYLMCDYGSNYLMVFLVKSKDADATKQVLEEFYYKILLLTKKKPATMQCDYDTVLQSAGITEWLRKREIKLQMSAPYTHWQNGKIERSMGKVMDKARTLMADGRVPTRFWSWAVRCAVYLLNRNAAGSQDTTPLEVATGGKPDISPLYPFWSIGVYHKTKEERKGPWDYKAVRVRLIGYCDEAKNSYYVYEIGTAKTIKVRHDCIWDETQLLEDEISKDNLEGDLNDDDLDAIEEELRERDLLEESAKEEDDEPSEEEQYWQEDGGTPYWALCTEVEMWVEEAHAAAVRAQPKPPEEEEPALEPIVQPASLKEALQGPDSEEWSKALQTEIANFQLRSVFSKAPQEGRAMKTKLILKKSRKPDPGSSNKFKYKFKVRLVAKGFTQIKGVNYNETYAPTTSTAVVLVVLQLAVIAKHNISSFDVTAAFLEGKNDYPNFAWLPIGFGELGGQRVQVVGNFYGEKQGPKIWNDRLNEILLKGGFERCPAHPCLYRKEDGKDVMFMCVHVDDGLVATSKLGMAEEFKGHLLSEVHEATFDDVVQRYIGIDVAMSRDERGLRVKLSHEQYINDNWSDFAGNKAAETPMSSSHNLRKAEPVVRELTMLPDTGKFRFACDRGRPDIQVATGEIATGGDKNPSHLHEVVAARTKQYLYDTRTLGIELGEGELEIFGYSDAAYITEGNCKSRLGGCVYLNRFSGAVRSFSKTDSQLSSVSHSSTEAEIKAMDEWVREVLHIVDVVSFLIGRRYDKPIKLFVDNQSAIHLCTTLKQSHNVKHINVRITFIRELVEAGFITIHFVKTQDNVADVLTKPLGNDLFIKHRKKLMVGHGGVFPSHKTL